MLTFPDFGSRAGVPAHIGMNAIPCARGGLPDVPVIYVAGTCMNSGKTSAACRLVRQLAMRGKAVGACKLTGVSLRRDTLQMSDYGAKWAVSFTDAGIVSTRPETAVTVAHGLVRHLAEAGAEVIVAELGDGILGDYGVAPILADRELMALSAAIVMLRQRSGGRVGGQAGDGRAVRAGNRRGQRPDDRQPRRHAVRRGGAQA